MYIVNSNVNLNGFPIVYREWSRGGPPYQFRQIQTSIWYYLVTVRLIINIFWHHNFYYKYLIMVYCFFFSHGIFMYGETLEFFEIESSILFG